MAGRKNPNFGESDEELGDFVPAVFARSLDEAEDYRQLLDDHDVPAIIGDEDQAKPPASAQGRKGFTRGVPVLVPEAMLDEAGEIIAEHDETNAFGLTEEVEEDEEENFGLDTTESMALGEEDIDVAEGEDEDEDDLFGDDDDLDEDDEDEDDELDDL